MADGRIKRVNGDHCPQCGGREVLRVLDGNNLSLVCEGRDCRHRARLGRLSDEQVARHYVA